METMPFGKHKGVPVTELDDGYLHWSPRGRGTRTPRADARMLIIPTRPRRRGWRGRRTWPARWSAWNSRESCYGVKSCIL